MIISLEKLSFAYPEGAPVFHSIELSIDKGDLVLIAGPNGAGKSTLLKLLNGILKPTAGKILVDGLDTSSTPTSTLASTIAVTFQNPGDQLFAATVQKEVMFGPKTLHRTNPAQLAENTLRLFGLGRFATRHPYDLASAQRKLLTIASAVASDCPILAFDEPSATLSQSERRILLSALQELKPQKRTLLIVSHDLDLFLPVVSKLIVLSDGKIKYSGAPDEIVRRPYLARTAGLRIPFVLRLGEHLRKAG